MQVSKAQFATATQLLTEVGRMLRALEKSTRDGKVARNKEDCSSLEREKYFTVIVDEKTDTEFFREVLKVVKSSQKLAVT